MGRWLIVVWAAFIVILQLALPGERWSAAAVAVGLCAGTVTGLVALAALRRRATRALAEVRRLLAELGE